MITIRKANPEEIDRINTTYDKVQFPHSHIENEFIAIAEIDHQKIGLGRIITIDQENAEMGGMYVDKNHREKGIATQIIQFLLTNNSGFTTIYCLPFEKLRNYYQKFGFEEVAEKDLAQVPQKITDKHTWCNKTFEEKVLLLSLKNE